MPIPQDIVKTLNQHKHRVNENLQPTLFPEIFGDNTHNDTEYWLMSDLQNMFGPQYFGMSKPAADHDSTVRSALNYEPVEKYFNRAKKHSNIGITELIQMRQMFLDNHVVTINNSYSTNVDNNTKKSYNAPDKQLSRYACWCIFKSHNTPDAILPRIYFIMPDASDADIYATAKYFLRIPVQKALARTRKNVNGMLYRNGMHFAIYNDMIIRTFFDTQHIDNIKTANNIPLNEKVSVVNHMNADAMHAMDMALRTMLNIINRQRYLNREIMTNIITTQMHMGRVALAQKCGLPENNLHPDEISVAQKKLNRLEKEFICQYAATKLR